MRIRTRYKLFQAVGVLAVLAFFFSLFDIFGNQSDLFIPVMIGFLVLLAVDAVLYVGRKPLLDEEGIETEIISATPEGNEPVPDDALEVVEVARSRPRLSNVQVAGPHHFRCPFCSNLFSVELTHLRGRSDFRMNCPYCSNTIRVPREPKVTAQSIDALVHAAPSDRAVFTCTHCGEVLRFTAPGSRIERFLHVQLCPNCRRSAVVPAVA